MIDPQLRGPVTKLMQPLYRLLARIGIHPHMLTMMGFGMAIIAGWAFATASYDVAAIAILMSGFFDILDGGVARTGGYASRTGALLDSIADRLGESAIYIGIVMSYSEYLYQLVALAMLVFSYSVSYLRARGEGLGIDVVGIGVMERPERMIALFGAAVVAVRLGPSTFIISLVVITSLVGLTVLYRFIRVYSKLQLSASS